MISFALFCVFVSYITAQSPDAGDVTPQTKYYHSLYLLSPTLLRALFLGRGLLPSFPSVKPNLACVLCVIWGDKSEL